MRRIGGALLSLMVVGCGPAAETADQTAARMTTESAAARQAIEASNAEMVQHFNQAHGDIVAQGYTEDAVLMIVGAPVARGREAIAQMVSGMAAMQPTLALTVESVVANGPLAVERGTYTFSMTPPGAPAPVTESGTTLVRWQKVGDQWLRADDMATSDKPLPPPPSPPAG